MGIFPPSSPQLACGQPSLWLGQTKDKGEVQGIDGFLLSSHGHMSSTAGTHEAKSYLRRDVAHHRSPWPPPCLRVVLAPSTHRWLCTTIPSPRSLGWAGLRLDTFSKRRKHQYSCNRMPGAQSTWDKPFIQCLWGSKGRKRTWLVIGCPC